MGNSVLTGSVVVVAVLLAATAFGLWRGRRDGRLRPVVGAVPAGLEVAATPAGLPTPAGSATLAGLPTPAGSATLAAATGAAPATPAAAGRSADPALLATLGFQPGTPATLLQFSSAFCAPCRATRRVLGEVSGLLEGVRHIEVDAETHLEAVRALGVWRTPTVLLLDGHGRVVQRASGVPAKAQVIAALAPLLNGGRP